MIKLIPGTYYRMLSGDGERRDDTMYKLVQVKGPQAQLETDEAFKFWVPSKDLYKSEHQMDRETKRQTAGPKLDRSKLEAARVRFRDPLSNRRIATYDTPRVEPIKVEVRDEEQLDPEYLAEGLRNELAYDAYIKSHGSEIDLLNKVHSEKTEGLNGLLQDYANSNLARSTHYGASARDYKYTDKDMLAFVKYCDRIRNY